MPILEGNKGQQGFPACREFHIRISTGTETRFQYAGTEARYVDAKARCASTKARYAGTKARYAGTNARYAGTKTS